MSRALPLKRCFPFLRSGSFHLPAPYSSQRVFRRERLFCVLSKEGYARNGKHEGLLYKLYLLPRLLPNLYNCRKIS